MKLSLKDLRRRLGRPPERWPALLIYGADPMRVALARAEATVALTGPGAAEEMRLTRLDAREIRRDPAALLDATKAVGFFPGPRAVTLEEATDAAAPAVEATLAAWAPGDATLLVAAGVLPARAKLRALFEKHPEATATPLYDDPPDRDEVARMATAAGLAADRNATEGLNALARSLDPGDLAQTIERIALWKLGDDHPLSADELARLAPGAGAADPDELIDAAAEGQSALIPPRLARLFAQGSSPVALAIAATARFRTLHAAAADPGGPGAGIARARPPVYGPRRTRLERQASAWGVAELERALGVLIEADLTLRSAARAPQNAVLERALLRVSFLAPS